MNAETETSRKSSTPRPLPVVDGDNKAFWSAARDGKLRMQKCTTCSHIRYPISAVCPQCLSQAHDWCDLSGRGTVFSTIVFHQVYHQAFAGDVPYNVSLIQLEEGPRMFSNVVGVPPASVKVGDSVEVVFEKLTEVVRLPRFRLTSPSARSEKEPA
jgi:uncharacterized protein